MTHCRVTDDLNALEHDEMAQQVHDEVAQQLHCERMDAQEAMMEDLDVQTCDVCQKNWPASELPLEGICESCVKVGVMLSDGLFQSQDGDLYAL